MDAIVELTLPKDANIYAAEYALYLPNKKTLQDKLREWLEEDDNKESLLSAKWLQDYQEGLQPSW